MLELFLDQRVDAAVQLGRILPFRNGRHSGSLSRGGVIWNEARFSHGKLFFIQNRKSSRPHILMAGIIRRRNVHLMRSHR